MQVLQTKRQEYNCTAKGDIWIFERIKESNEEHFVNLCESNSFESHTTSSVMPAHATNSELPRTYLPVESIQNK